MLVVLPNGLVESNGTELFDHIKIDELRGKQQNYLVDKKLVEGNIGHIPKILEDMILSIQDKEGREWKGNIKDAINKLCIEDLEYILIKIRENTYGPKYYFSSNCPKCGNLIKNLKLELDKLDVVKMSLDDLNKELSFKLPKSEQEIVLKELYLNDLFKSLKIINNNSDTLITSTLALIIKRIDNNENVTESDVSNLSGRDLNALNNFTKDIKIRGFIDTDIQNTCEKCEFEYTDKLNPFVYDFFDPSRGSPS